MFKINENYCKLPGNYLFFTIRRKVEAYRALHPDQKVISLGIGDATQPLAPAVIQALHDAVAEMGEAATFKGYAPDLGYAFLRERIAKEDFASFGYQIDADEIFVSDGAKCDSSNIQEIFDRSNRIAVADPVYPVYVDSNVMAGRTGTYDTVQGTWSDVIYMPCTAENHFTPQIPAKETIPDMIYLCSPNNPTGTAMDKESLQRWVDYANEIGAVILFDAAYEAYITQDNVPHSIYECSGARTCAIEMRSFSKRAGFTGLRLGYTVVPKELKSQDVSLHSLWARRYVTKYNGAPYIVQRAGEAVYSPEGKAQTMQQVAAYLHNAATIREGLSAAGYEVYGGTNAPYIWMRIPHGMDGWQFFDHLLDTAHVVVTPGTGFGPSGDPYVRLTAFGSYEDTKEAIDRIKRV
ncbi:MAG: LL-diaminopimelate aminotransferase [Lachnospiraceae bacterium]|jgi:LL-diaminopimelate aminotransferase|nr:LL-diaminopimelate aminotransferase [Lachnospiraceae bacterium]